MEPDQLTSKDRKIIEETFTKMDQNREANGLSILIRLISEHPEYKNIWPQFREYPDSVLMSTMELKQHANVYMGGLKTIINSIEDDQTLTAQLKNIARAHLKHNIQKSHVMNMLPHLLETVKKGVKATDAEVEEAWTNLFIVISTLIEKYRARKIEIRKRKRFPK